MTPRRAWWIVVLSFAAARAETLDMATFTGPEGWQRDTKPGLVSFGMSDARTGAWGVVTVFVSQPGGADPAADFRNAWQALVPGVAVPAPTTAKTSEGLPFTAGAAQTTDGQLAGATVVLTIHAHGRFVPIMAKSNSPEVLKTLDLFFAGIKIVKPGSPAAAPAPAGDVGAYVYRAPDGWKTQAAPAGIRLSDDRAGCVLDLLPLRKSGPSLEADADVVFNETFPGWKRANYSTGAPYVRVSKGVSADGWEFIKVQSFLEQPGRSMLGLVFVARLGERSAVVAGGRPGDEQAASLAIVTGTPVCFDEYLSLDWATFYHGLHFKGWKGPPGAIAQQMVGKWSSSAYNVAVYYAFGANGRYLSAHGYETVSRLDAATLLKTTHGFVGNGAYKVAGNELTLTPDGKKPEVGLVRWERMYELGQWSEVLRVIQTGADGKPFELRLIREK